MLLLRLADINNTGAIDYKEFIFFLNSMDTETKKKNLPINEIFGGNVPKEIEP